MRTIVPPLASAPDLASDAYVTDSGNFILDCHWPAIPDPSALAAAIKAITGVVDHGLFIGLARRVIVAGTTGVRSMSTPSPAKSGPSPARIFLYDVDNTLLNNDQLKADADTQLFSLLGDQWSDIFWQIYEDVRHQEDVVDIPKRCAVLSRSAQTPTFATKCGNFEHVDFAHYLYPGALAALRYTATLGTNVIVSDGDPKVPEAQDHGERDCRGGAGPCADLRPQRAACG